MIGHDNVADERDLFIIPWIRTFVCSIVDDELEDACVGIARIHHV